MGEALARISALYAIDAEITRQPADWRREARQRRAVPLPADPRAWLEGQAGPLSAKTALAEAIQYALGRWTAVLLYTGDRRIGIDNNPVECNALPEHCGGIPAFYDIVAILADPDHPDHAEITGWIEEYDPDTIDELPMQYALSRIARRRNAAAKRFRKNHCG